MITLPIKIKERLIAGIKKYKTILINAKEKDINESDTVAILNDILHDIFGYEKYTEITSEYSIKKTFCDLAIKLNDQVRLLIEVKPAGVNLKDQYIQQATNYGVNAGIDWVILTNGVYWKIYKIGFAKPVVAELLYEFDLTEINTRKDAELELIYYLTKEAMGKSSKASIDDFLTHKKLLNKYIISQIILSEPLIDTIKKQLKKIQPDIKTNNEEISQIIYEEVLKRDVLEDENAKTAKKKVSSSLVVKKKAPEEISQS